MSGFFGVASKEDCVFDVFFGTDYHSHLGTRRAGLAVYSQESGFEKAIHSIENAPFRTRFTSDYNKMKGNLGIGCISDFQAQPMLVRSQHGTYAITTVGKINNTEELAKEMVDSGTHFFEMSNGEINATELVASLINTKQNFIEGIQYAQSVCEGSLSMLILTPKGIYAARDKLGRTPISLAQKLDAYCASFESFAYLNLGYKPLRELGPGEIAIITPTGVKTLVAPGKDMKICTFLWVYYGYPSSSYEGLSVEKMRYNCGAQLAKRDDVKVDYVAGVPDSGIAHAIGYVNQSGSHYARPFVKYTPTWPRSFMPPTQSKRELIARMKLIPIHDLIENKNLLLIDDSIVRGTQLRETADFLFDNGAREVHIRTACPPIFFGCKYLNFSRSNSPMELIANKVIYKLEGVEPTPELIAEYSNPDSEKHKNLVEEIRRQQHFTSLKFHRLDDMIESTGLPAEKLCTYCWNGKE